MAELPLVEAMRRTLGPRVMGRRIENVRVLRDDRIIHPGPAVFAQLATGGIIEAMDRRGKYLGLRLQDGSAIWFHFMMNGQLHLVDACKPLLSHTHLVLELDDGTQLRHRDTRCLSRIWLLEPGEQDTWTGLCSLGPDALSEEFTSEHLACALAATRRPIKTCLLDQHLVAGIGNIYADEALFEARLSPLRAASSLSDQEVARLHQATRGVLQFESDRLSENPERFLGMPFKRRRPAGWKAYGRKGKPCKACGQALASARIGGRTSVYCPSCQK